MQVRMTKIAKLPYSFPNTHAASLFFCHRNKDCEWFVGKKQMKLVDLSCKTLMQEIPMKMRLYVGIVIP